MTLQTVSVYEGLYSLIFSSDDLGISKGALRMVEGTKPCKFNKNRAFHYERESAVKCEKGS